VVNGTFESVSEKVTKSDQKIIEFPGNKKQVKRRKINV